MEPTTVLGIHLFGPMSVTLCDNPLPRLRSRTGYWLLALLALRLGRDVSREWLAATLWPDSESSQAFYNLRRLLTDLRQALGPEYEHLLAATPKTVTLLQEGVWVDALDFDAAIARGEVSSLEEVIALYTGALLEGCTEEWAVVERTYREQQYLSALEKIATQATAEGNPAAAVRALRLLVAADPLHEENQRALMQALADCGDPAAVTQVYRDLRLLLHRELNAAPAPETEALYRRLQEPVQQPTLPPAPPPRPPASPRRLPVPLTRLIGREEEVEDTAEWLRVSRLITLVGPGGVGKTRLSIAVGEASAREFADGVWFVELAALTDPSLIPQTVAKSLSLTAQPDRSLTETLLEALSERSLLLILDNCEHLIEACAQFAHTLLTACSGVHLLATSREPLRITGERLVPVPSLELPLETNAAESKDIHALLDYAGIQLFVERAVMIQPTFRLSRQNAPAVIQICRHLDGIPLAIELAAAHLRGMTLDEMTTHLKDRFALLTRGSRAALPRHQTLYGLIAWSYDLLTEAERALFRCLSVFVGGWKREAAEVVCQERGVVDLLTSLRDKSLLEHQEQEGVTRYRMLETVREYAREQLRATGEEPCARNRHRDYYLALAEEADGHLIGPEQSARLVQLEREHDNLRAALEWSHHAPDGVEKEWRLIGALFRFWILRGYMNEGRAHCERALARTSAEMRTQARARALYGTGQLISRQGDTDAARALLAESLTLFQELGDKIGCGNALNAIGLAATAKSDYAAARPYLEESLSLLREIGNRVGMATTLNSLGLVAWYQGDYAAAQARHEESLAIKQELGNRSGIAFSLNNLGLVAMTQGDYLTAQGLLLESLAIREEQGDRWGIADTRNYLGMIAYYQGDMKTARRLFDENLNAQRELGNKGGVAGALNNLGLVEMAEGEYALAHEHLATSLTIDREIEDKRAICLHLEACAALAAQSGHPERAARLWGAIQSLRDWMHAHLPQNEQAAHECHTSAVRKLLGEEAFTAAWSEGRSLRLEQAIALALRHPVLEAANSQ